MKFSRNTIWLIPLFLLITFPLWSIPVSKFLAPRGGYDAKAQKTSTDSQNFEMKSVKIIQNQKGKTTAIIRAVQAQTGKDPDIYLMQHVNADLLDDDGKITNVVAKAGKYNSISKLLTLIEDVVVNKIEERQFLYTDLLHYSSLKRTIKCPGKMRLVGDDIQIDGGSLDYDITSKTYDIGKRVHCILDGFIEP